MTKKADQSRRIVLVSRPKGTPRPTDFRLEEGSIPEPGDGELLLETQWLSLDPYMRGRMDDQKSYAAPVPVGGVMEGEVIAQVLAPEAFIGMLQGRNYGRLLVRVASPR
jgi:hypothetical protein